VAQQNKRNCFKKKRGKTQCSWTGRSRRLSRRHDRSGEQKNAPIKAHRLIWAQYFTFELLRDPVIAADGFTYERESIERWFANGNERSPKTGVQLQSKLLFPNHDLRARICEWRAHGDEKSKNKSECATQK
jgi:hypothetical protein